MAITNREGPGITVPSHTGEVRDDPVQQGKFGTRTRQDDSRGVRAGGAHFREHDARRYRPRRADLHRHRSLNDTFADTGNAIRSNSIYQNEDLCIDLHQDGPTANDPKDPDAGENDLQNKPAVTSAVTANGTTTVKGKLNSTPDETFQIEFFTSPSGDEGKKLLDQRFVTTNANGDATYVFATSKGLAAGQRITATATDAGRNTSEFSAPRTVVAR